MAPARVLLLCVAGVFQMLLKTSWVLRSFPHTGSNRETARWASPPRPRGQSLFLSFFLSFLLMLVVGAPQHEKQKHQRDEKVGGIDRDEGQSFSQSLRSLSFETTGFGEIIK